MTTELPNSSLSVPTYKKQKVVAVLPNYMSARNFISSGSAMEIAQRANLTCLVYDNLLPIFQSDAEEKGFTLLPIPSPSRFSGIINSVITSYLPSFSSGGLAYRFNHLNGFIGHKIKSKFSKEDKEREAIAGNFVDSKYGWFLPKSKFLYLLLSKLYWNRFYIDQNVKNFLTSLSPDLMYFSQIQATKVRDYIIYAHNNNIPRVGNVASWDQPTTKGPLPPNLTKYLVQSRWMAEQLKQFHKVPSSLIAVTGWPQMDCYLTKINSEQENELKKNLKIPRGKKIIFLGMSSARLGKHEPDFVKYLAQYITKHKPNWHLLIRPHPNSQAFSLQLKHEIDENVASFVEHDFENLQDLRNQLLLSDITVTSFGSIALDATALGKPSIYISNNDAEYPQSLEHLSSVVNTGAVPIASTPKDLVEVLNQALSTDHFLAAERANLTLMHLAPNDGFAVERITNQILTNGKIEK